MYVPTTDDRRGGMDGIFPRVFIIADYTFPPLHENAVDFIRK